jgi:exonuclease I
MDANKRKADKYMADVASASATAKKLKADEYKVFTTIVVIRHKPNYVEKIIAENIYRVWKSEGRITGINRTINYRCVTAYNN